MTCGEPIHRVYQAQAGHFIPKARGNAIYWDMRGIHPQCGTCNKWLGGNGAEYFIYIERTFGRATADHLRIIATTQLKLQELDYIEMIEEVKGWMKELEERRRNGNYEPMRVNFKILEEL